MDEVWKPVVGFEGFYEVSNCGRVRALERQGWHKGRWGQLLMKFPAREMKIGIAVNGYRYVKLRRPGAKAVHCLVHRLVMAAYVGPAPDGMHVNHMDGDKGNNCVSNLEYVTPLQNLRHCIDVLGKKRGEGGASKLTEKQVISIRSDTRKLREIAADYGVTLQAIWMVKKGRSWVHVC